MSFFFVRSRWCVRFIGTVSAPGPIDPTWNRRSVAGGGSVTDAQKNDRNRRGLPDCCVPSATAAAIVRLKSGDRSTDFGGDEDPPVISWDGRMTTTAVRRRTTTVMRVSRRLTDRALSAPAGVSVRDGTRLLPSPIP